MIYRSSCWNCGSEEHLIGDCPFVLFILIQPHNVDTIRENRSISLPKPGTGTGAGRYYKNPIVSEKGFENFRPGVVGPELQNALGIEPDEEPPYLKRMVILGYPPAYIKGELSDKINDLVIINNDEDEKKIETVDDSIGIIIYFR